MFFDPLAVPSLLFS